MPSDNTEKNLQSPEVLRLEIIDLINKLSDGGLSEIHRLVLTGKFPDQITKGNGDHDLGEADIITTLYPDDLMRGYASVIQNFLQRQLQPGLRMEVGYSSPQNKRLTFLLGNPDLEDVLNGNYNSSQRHFTLEAIEVLKEAIKTGNHEGRYTYFPDETPPIFRLNSRFRRYIPSQQPWKALAMLNMAPLESSLENKIYQLTEIGSVEGGFFSGTNLIKNSRGKTQLSIYFSSLGSLGQSINIDLSGQKMKIADRDVEKLQMVLKALSQKYSLTHGEKDIMTTKENFQLLFKPLLMALQ